MTEINMTHVPYKGSGPAAADLLAGQVKVGFPGIAIAIPHVKSGKLRALGTTGAKRSPGLPEVPSIAEAGVKGYDATQWMGFAGPRGLPAATVQRIRTDTLRVLSNPETVKALIATGNEVYYHDSPEAFRAFMQEEARKWAHIVKTSGAQVN